MGKRGPKPTPTAIKRARGTYRADRDPAGSEPNASKRAPIKIPESVLLNADALACWRATAPKLRALGTLTSSDVLVFESLCMAQATATAASRELREGGGKLTVIGSHGGDIANPLIKIERDARQTVAKLSAEFGLTPAARTRVRGDAPVEKKPTAKDAADPKKNPNAFLFGNQHRKVAGHIGA